MEQFKILIVDDDEAAAGLIKLRLNRDAPHFSVGVVEDGRECIEYLESNGVDCIISDYHMPGMNGIELLRALRRQGNDIPFLIMTGHGGEDVARDASRAGAYDYFPKGLGLNCFTQVINSIENALALRAVKRGIAKSGSPVNVDEAHLYVAGADGSKAVWCFDMDPPIPVSLVEEEQLERIFRHSYLVQCNEEGARILGLDRDEDSFGLRYGCVVSSKDPRNVEQLKKAIRSGYWLRDDEIFTRDTQGRTRRLRGSFSGIVEHGCLVRAWRVAMELTDS